MNKKLLLLLPIAALLLGGCKSDGSSIKPFPEDEEEEEEEIPPYDAALYGTEDSPLTVAQALATANQYVKKEQDKFSYYPFYVRGVVKENALFNSSKSNFDVFYMKDSLSGTDQLKVVYAISSVTTNGMLCKGDTVTVKSFVEYHDGIYTFYKKNTTDPEVYSITRGQSHLTVTNNAPTIVTVTETLDGDYQNLSTVTMHASSNNANYAVVVTVDGGVLTPVDGAYTIQIKGATEVVVDVDYQGPRDNLPAGDYTLKISKDNAQLGTSSTAAAKDIQYAVKEDNPAESLYYKRVNVNWSKNIRANSSYNEITFGGNSNSGGTAVINIPNGKITKLSVCTFQDKAFSVFFDPNESLTKSEDNANYLKFTDDETHHIPDIPGYNSSFLRIWDIPTEKQGTQLLFRNDLGSTDVNIFYFEVLFTVA